MNQEFHASVYPKQNNIFGTINPQKIVKLILNKWYWYLITIVLCSVGAVYYMNNKLPTYNVTTSILIEEEDSSMPDENLLQGFALQGGVQNLDNQMFIITSYSMVRKAISLSTSIQRSPGSNSMQSKIRNPVAVLAMFPRWRSPWHSRTQPSRRRVASRSANWLKR